MDSTKQAIENQKQLYSAMHVDGEGILPYAGTSKHPSHIESSVNAVNAAHESKTPGMLAQLLKGLVKYIKDEKKFDPVFNEYFEIHIGQNLVYDILVGHKTQNITDRLLTPKH